MASAEKGKQLGLGLFDAISIIVGIVIGTTIFKVPFLIFGSSSDPWMALTVWFVGGILALIGALCYAELATTYPRSGGDYFYLTRGFSPGVGFLFGWAQLVVVFTASIGAMAFVFGEYATKIEFFKRIEDQVDFKQLDNQIGGIGLTDKDGKVNLDFVYACLAVIVLTFLNMLGVLAGKLTQNLLTLVKVVSLGAILFAGFYYYQSTPLDWALAHQETARFEGSGGERLDKEFVFKNADWEVGITLSKDDKGTKLISKFKNLHKEPQKLDLKLLVKVSREPEAQPVLVEAKKDFPAVPVSEPETVKTIEVPVSGATGIYDAEMITVPRKTIGWEALAMILVLYAFGGWNDAAFVAAEVRNPQRNIPRALIIGVSLITVVYLAVNTAYMMGLGFDGVQSPGVPSRLLERAVVQWQGDEWKGWGEQGMSILIVISALGAVNGLMFTGARVYATLGNDYTLFGWMGFWKPGRGAPILALLVQGIFTLGMIYILGTRKGHELINELLSQVHIEHESQWTSDTAFQKLVDHTAPVFWFFFLLTGFSLFLLRARDTTNDRPFSVPFYPWLPIIFCGACIFMLFQSTAYVGWRALFAMGLSLLGIPLYWLACLFGGYRGDRTTK